MKTNFTVLVYYWKCHSWTLGSHFGLYSIISGRWLVDILFVLVALPEHTVPRTRTEHVVSDGIVVINGLCLLRFYCIEHYGLRPCILISLIQITKYTLTRNINGAQCRFSLLLQCSFSFPLPLSFKHSIFQCAVQVFCIAAYFTDSRLAQVLLVCD